MHFEVGSRAEQASTATCDGYCHKMWYHLHAAAQELIVQFMVRSWAEADCHAT